MLDQIRYSEYILNKIDEVQSNAYSILSYYHNNVIYYGCVAINLVMIINQKGLVGSLTYKDCDCNIVNRSITNPFKFTLNQRQPSDLSMYEIIFSELNKQNIVIDILDNNKNEYNLYKKDIFGPTYINLEGYTVSLFNNQYYYNDLKPLGTFIGHILTNQPFSYQNYLINHFNKNEDGSYDSND